EQMKYMMTQLYDDLLFEIIYEMKNVIKKLNYISFYNAEKFLDNINKNALYILKSSPAYTDFENFLYTEKYHKIIPKYDEEEDKFYGIHGNVIKLPEAPKKLEPKIQTIVVDITNSTQSHDDNNDGNKYESIGICQHNVTWNYISKIQKSDIGKFSDALFQFTEQYVTETQEQEFVCKSCGYLLSIKKYITDGVYDDVSQKFVAFSTAIEIPLEETAEYAKYAQSIRYIDKIIERIATLCNMLHFIGTSHNARWKRKSIIKDVIDLIITNNKYLKK